MWQTKYASAVPKNLGLELNFRPCSEGYFLYGRPKSVAAVMSDAKNVTPVCFTTNVSSPQN